MITGINESKARFQVVSLVTNTGFTTEDSELIMNSKLRKKIAKFIVRLPPKAEAGALQQTKKRATRARVAPLDYLRYFISRTSFRVRYSFPDNISYISINIILSCES